ncbi:MAG TPA: glycosyltransferase [Candidatus Angelobacter sp.]|nr:glycosyltransferase [Candidatus Angelobacter sp.]
MSPLSPRPRSILFVSTLAPYSTSAYRFESLRRLGQRVHAFDLRPYAPKTSIAQWLQFRYPLGPLVTRINRELREVVAASRPDAVWFEKPTVFTPETMQAIRGTGASVIFYVQDAPFGPRKDGCWRQFLKVYPLADLHCLFRQADVARYRAWGLPYLETMFSFDPAVHYPAPDGFGDADRIREVSYIGHPHEQRPAFLIKLAREYGLSVSINGNRWERALTPEDLQTLIHGPFLANEHYRSAIWKSKINLSFVTEDNQDDIAHKAVEVAACGGFLLAVRTPGHQAIFEEDREAVFFSSVEECAEKCQFYLGRPDLREAIAARGRERAVRSGYDNDTQLARILNRLDGSDG